MTSASDASAASDETLRKTIHSHLIVVGLICLAIIGGVGGWMATARISGAVVTSGTVVVESNIKRVQHREGGIIQEIAVKNGDTVEAGDLLIRLDDTVIRANLAVVVKQLAELGAQESRLLAERDGLETVQFSEVANLKVANLDNIRRGQQLLLDARRASMIGRKQQLKEQIRQLDQQIEGLSAQVRAKQEEIDLIGLELVDLNGLLEKQLVPKSRIIALKRERARLEGEHGDFLAQIAKSREAISEREIQSLQIEETYRAEVLEKLQEARSRIAQLEEQKITAEDELRRIDVRAPRNGFVHQLAVHTVGGVISPGEVLMLIVPREDQLIIESHVRPVDIDQLAPNQKARVRFPSFDRRTTPELSATLLTVSADLSQDERTGQGYYTARLAIDDTEMAKLEGKTLIPGMPVEAYLTTGDRTVLSYLIKPLRDQIAHALRER